MGGLMQLVAYGAMDVYLTGNPVIDWTYGSKPKKPQFFYDKIKNSNYSKKIKKLKEQFQFTKPKPPSSNYDQVKIPKVKKQTMFSRAQKNFPQNIRNKLNGMLKVKKYYNQLIEKYIRNPNVFNFNDKIKTIESIKPIVQTINKHKYLQTCTSYFVGDVNVPGFYRMNKNFIAYTKSLSHLVLLHSFLIVQLDIDNPIIKPKLKDTICSITYETICNEYVECPTCSNCFDYSNDQVKYWFISHRKCAVCKQTFNPIVKHVGGENHIYNELKKNAKNT